MILKGFIYLTETKSDNVEVLPTQSGKTNTTTSNNATVHGTVNKASAAAVQKLGIRVAKQGSDYSTGKTYKYTPNGGTYTGNTYIGLTFDIKNEVGYTLTHATTYKYQIYAQVNGKDYWSAEKTFTTTGSHSYGGWSPVSSATCTAAGRQKRTCSCGAVETKAIAATGHIYSSSYTVDKQPACTAAGSKSKHCTKCSAKTGVTAIAATGHSFGGWTTDSSATCTAAGSQKRTCSCGAVETKAIAATGHIYSSSYTVDKQPACTAAGSKSKHCTKCSAKTGVTAIAATGHNFGAWKVETQATTAKDGKEIRTCGNPGCGKAETRTIPKLPEEGHVHSFGQWTQSVAATCTAEGTQVSVCSGCGAQQTMTVAAVGHQYQTQEVTNPDGSKQINFACANCSDVIVSEILPPAPGEEITPTETAESLPEESSADNTEAMEKETPQDSTPAKNSGIIIAVAAGAVLAGAGAGAATFFALRKKKK